MITLVLFSPDSLEDLGEDVGDEGEAEDEGDEEDEAGGQDLLHVLEEEGEDATEKDLEDGDGSANSFIVWFC